MIIFPIIIVSLTIYANSGLYKPEPTVNGLVPDSAHGRMWKASTAGKLILITILFSLVVAIINSDRLAANYLFAILLFSTCGEFLVVVLIPSIIRLISNKQHGIGISFFIAFLSYLLACLYWGMISQLNMGADFSDGFIRISFLDIPRIFYTCAAYKIMRSVAGFSSVFPEREKNEVEVERLGEKSSDDTASEPKANGNSVLIFLAFILTMIALSAIYLIIHSPSEKSKNSIKQKDSLEYERYGRSLDFPESLPPGREVLRNKEAGNMEDAPPRYKTTREIRAEVNAPLEFPY